MTDEQKTQNEKKEVIWGQLRVPNIKKGYNTNYPFYMMGIFIGLAVLSGIFAFLTG